MIIVSFTADGWGFYYQREAVEALIQELPKFSLKAVPTDCSECPICLEEFRVGNEVKFALIYYLKTGRAFLVCYLSLKSVFLSDHLYG